MTIETDEQYRDAARKIELLAQGAIDGEDDESFLTLTAAMLDYELRSRAAVSHG